MKLHNKVEIPQGFVWDIIEYIHNRNNKIKPLSPPLQLCLFLQSDLGPTSVNNAACKETVLLTW